VRRGRRHARGRCHRPLHGHGRRGRPPERPDARHAGGPRMTTSEQSRTIAVVSAGLSQPSSTRLLADRLADAAVRELEDLGHPVRVETIELRDLAHPVVDAMLTGFATGDLARAQEAVTGADGVIAVTPVFTSSFSGLFKSFWDILDPDALSGMPVLL